MVCGPRPHGGRRGPPDQPARLLHLLHSTVFSGLVFYIEPPSTFVFTPPGAKEKPGALGVGAAAFAVQSGPKTDEVVATLDFMRVEGKGRTCEGRDGTYDSAKVRATGTSSGDPRLAGKFEVEIDVLDKFDEETGALLGTTQGKFIVRDPQTGKVKVDARILAVDKDEEIIGFVRGQAQGEDGGDLFGNLRINFVEEIDEDAGTGTFDVEGQLGGTTVSREMPAVIQSGQCKGRFERFAFDLPQTFELDPPQARSAPNSAGDGSGWRGIGR